MPNSADTATAHTSLPPSPAPSPAPSSDTPLSDVIRQQVRSAKARFTRALLARSLTVALAASLATAALEHLLQLGIPVWTASLAYAGLALWRTYAHPSQRLFEPGNYLRHLNRQDPHFEESAQLLQQPEAKLSLLQAMQKQKIGRYYLENVARHKAWLPRAPYKPLLVWLLVSVLITPIFLFAPGSAYTPSTLSDGATIYSANTSTAAANGTRLPTLIGAEARITPPEYTGLKAKTTQGLDLEALEGSDIVWHLTLGRTAGRYSLRLRSGTTLTLTPASSADTASSTATYTARTTANATTLYQLVHTDTQTSDETIIGAVNTLSVQRDKAPQIRTLNPRGTTLEIPKAGPATFTSEVLIADDFGISDVLIQASVAKGSGEAVKFRDETFRFDSTRASEQGTIYTKNWSLLDLGMEPGDEIYYTVTAADNKAPTANTSKSGTIIVRWLDDAKQGIAADGVVSDFVPEYFKSQRQIIIETEQLVADRSVLGEDVFRQTSYGLGSAQSDLKQRYGQYLGDEFGEGPGGQLAGTHADTPHTDEDGDKGEHDDKDGNAHASETGGHKDSAASTPTPPPAAEPGHAHDAGESGDRSGATDLIARFGHAHGQADIGPIAAQDPKAQMKRAVSAMWQAELHLLLAEPQKALPFEYEALTYLNLAKQADRIYVKRLGFEPPPVSEERRLTGELDDIGSYKRPLTPRLESLADERTVASVFTLIASVPAQHRFSERERQTLSRLSALLTEMAQERPAMITHAATIEKMLISGTARVPDCEACITQLQSALWGLLPAPTAPPQHRAAYSLSRKANAYNQGTQSQGTENQAPEGQQQETP